MTAAAWLMAGWGVIGWVALCCLSIGLVIFVYAFARRMWIDFWYEARRKLHRLMCSRGDHGPDFFMDRARHEWFDPANNTYVTEVHRFKKCKRCWKPIEGTDEVEAKSAISKHAIQNFVPLYLRGRT